MRRDRIACCLFGASFFCTAKSLESEAGLSASAPWFACPAFRFSLGFSLGLSASAPWFACPAFRFSLGFSLGLSASAPWFACPAFSVRIVQNDEETLLFFIMALLEIPTRPWARGQTRPWARGRCDVCRSSHSSPGGLRLRPAVRCLRRDATRVC
jgi:hypothetical protein